MKFKDLAPLVKRCDSGHDHVIAELRHGQVVLADGRQKLKDTTVVELFEWLGEALGRGWQPIETAPRDGRHILAVDLSDLVGFGLYDGRVVPRQTVVHWWPHWPDEGFYVSVSEQEAQHPFLATHWASLDVAPTLSKERT